MGVNKFSKKLKIERQLNVHTFGPPRAPWGSHGVRPGPPRPPAGGKRGAVSAEEIDPLHEVATEMENIEFDDVSNASQTHLWERYVYFLSRTTTAMNN